MSPKGKVGSRHPAGTKEGVIRKRKREVGGEKSIAETHCIKKPEPRSKCKGETLTRYITGERKKARLAQKKTKRGGCALRIPWKDGKQ